MPSKKSSTKKPKRAAKLPEGKSRAASKPAAGKRSSSLKKPSLKKNPAAEQRRVSPFPLTPPGTKKSPRPPRSPQQLLKVAEALRVAGLDELRLAKTLRWLINSLLKPEQNFKLLLDVIKEWGRYFPEELSADRAASDAPVPIHLIHNVPRPDHSGRGENSTELRDFAGATPDTSGA
jgi:hypothetical protein